MKSKLSIGDLQSDLFDAAAEGNIEVLGEDYIAKYGKDEVLSFKTPDTGNTIVLIAVRYGHSAFIKKAISLSPDLLRQKNNNGNTPLHEAAQWGTKETVKLLISHLEKSNSGSSSNSSSNNFLEVNCDGDTPFHVALRSRNMAVAEELFSYVKDHPEILLMKSNLRKQTPLHLYVQYCAGVSESQYIEYDDYGDVAFKQTLFFQLMKANFLAIYELDSEGLSPLMRAAQLGRVLVVSMLLRYRQAIECRDSKGRSFLHYLRLGMNDLNAKDRNYTVNVCKMILEHPGVDILICSRDQDGNTPLHLAILDKDLDLARLISERYIQALNNSKGKTPFHLIKFEPDILEILKKLMEEGSKGKEMDDELYYAAEKLDMRVYENNRPYSYFISQDVDGKNILHIALQLHHKSSSDKPVGNNYKAFIKETIKRFPKLTYQKDYNGDTPLHIAARFSSDASTILLQESFQYWNARRTDDNWLDLEPLPWKVKDSRGHTPFHEAARTENWSTLRLMFNALGNASNPREAMEEVNKYGETVLHLIARYMKMTDDSGLDVKERDSKHMMLDDCESAAYIRDVDGLTPLLRAAHSGRVKLVFDINGNYPKSVKISDYKGRNVMHHLCTSAFSRVADLERLIQFWEMIPSRFPGADELILPQDDDGNTPLHLAIMNHNFEVAHYLFSHYVKVKSSSFTRALKGTRNKQGKSIMHLITSEQGVPVNLKELIEQAGLVRIMDDNLYEAATKGDVGYIEKLRLVDRWFSLDCQSHDGSNILHIALRHHHIPLIECVLDGSHMLMSWKDSKGDTPLHLAAGLFTNEAFTFLELCLNTWIFNKNEYYLEGPAPWKVRNSKGNTYLHEAARLCNYKVIFSAELLNGKDIKDVNDRGETVLHVIARYANNTAKNYLENLSEQMQSLVYIQDLEGFTPVLRALRHGRLGVATFLIGQCPRSIGIPDNKGRTVLHHLRGLVVDLVDDIKDILPVWNEFFKHPGVDDLRIEQNVDGNTPLHLSIIDGDFTKAKFLMEKCLQSKNKRELDIVNNDGHSVFDLVSSRAHIPATKELQSLVSRSYVKERELIDKVMDDELYWAAVNGDYQIFESISNDATTNDAESRPPILPEAYFCSQTPGGSNMIHIALRHGGKTNVEQFIEIALQKYPILSMRPDNNGDTPLHLAAKWKSGVSSLESLIKASKAFLQALEESTKAFHVAPWAVKNYKGSFPIHEALQTGNLEAANALLGCDTEAASRVNDLGDTPLHSFAKNGFSNSDGDHVEEFVDTLLKKSNQAAYMRDDDGLTPLLSAARSGRLQVAQAILLYRPQSAYLRDPSGRTFLHLLRFTGEDIDESLAGSFENTGKQLFEIPEADAQRLVQDYEGNTPLHYAIKTQNTVAAIVLTQRCLDDEEQRELGLVNNEGHTIPDLLASHDVPNEVIELIRKKMPKAVYLARSSYGIRKTEMKDSANALSVVAALLATITFAAGLQVPGGFDENDGSPVLMAKPAFTIFVVANTTAMSCSMLCLFLLLWVMGIGKIHGSLMVLDISIILLRLSFYLTLLTFTMGVYVTTIQKSLWLGIVVCVLGFLTFLLTWKFSIKTVAKYGGRAHISIKTFIKFVNSKCSQYIKV